MKVVFSNRAFTSILSETTEKIKTETGGLFLGTVEDDVWYVIESIDPGPKSIFEVAYFEYDQKYTQHLINKIANLYNHRLTLIGLWYSHIEYDIGDHLIPDRFLELKAPDTYYSMMDEILHGGVSYSRKPDGYHVAVSLESFLKLITPHMAELIVTDLDTTQMQFDSEAQERVLDAILDDLTFLANDARIEVTMTMLDNSLVMSQDAIDTTTSMYFGYSKQKKSVVVSCVGKCYLYRTGLLKEMYIKAKEHRNCMCEEGYVVKPVRKRDGLFGQVIKVIRFNKSEE